MWYTFNSQFYQQTGGVAKGRPTSSQQKFICRLVYRLLCLWLYFLKKVGNNIWWYYFILKRKHLEKFFHHINNLHQNIKFTIESKRELTFVDTVLRLNNEKIAVLAYGKPMHTDQYLHYSSPHQANCNDFFPPCLLAYFVITLKII